MKIVIAVDSFKGSLSTMDAGRRIEEGILRIVPDASTLVLPVADGGEGTVETMVQGSGGSIELFPVQDLLGRPANGQIGYVGEGIAILEMASPCGLSMLTPSRESVRRATTYGLGQLFMRAVEKGCRTIYIGLGGSGTNDGGMGFAQALGYRFYDGDGRLIPNGRGSLLQRVGRVDAEAVDPRLAEISVEAITDVDSPLLGSAGSANVFGRQKGMDEALVWEFDRAMEAFMRLLQRDLGAGDLDVPCAGAGGGMGMGLMAFTRAKIRRGIDAVLDIARFDDHIADADLVVTGEGRLDFQSVRGKVPIGVTERARRQGKATVAVVGSVGQGYELAFEHGLAAIESAVCSPQRLEEAMDGAPQLVAAAAERLMRAILVGWRLRGDLNSVAASERN